MQICDKIKKNGELYTGRTYELDSIRINGITKEVSGKIKGFKMLQLLYNVTYIFVKINQKYYVKPCSFRYLS